MQVDIQITITSDDGTKRTMYGIADSFTMNQSRDSQAIWSTGANGQMTIPGKITTTFSANGILLNEPPSLPIKIVNGKACRWDFG